jgi:uncharacterized protein (TIGR03083 family)
VQTATSYLERVLPAIDHVASRFAALVTAAPNPATRVPNTPGWTVRDIAAHLATVVVRYADGPKGRGTWTSTPLELPALNHDQMQALGTVPVGALAAGILRDLATLRAQVQGYGSRPPFFRFHGGEPVRADIALGLLLGELVVHGYDVARALRRPWPIDPDHAALIIEALNPILPGWVRPERTQGFTATFELTLRGQAAYIWAFHDGRLRVNPPHPGVIDVHVSGDPAALLLVFYARQPQWKHIATGQMLAWGRKPWLALTLTSHFHQP